LQTCRPHILAISETWFSDDSVPNISGYSLFRRNRVDRGGGVCIYVRRDLVAGEVSDDVLSSHESEQVWCSISVGGERVLVCCFYRPPNACNLSLIALIGRARDLLERRVYTSLILVGDFNYPNMFRVEDGLACTLKEDEMRFIEAVRDSFFTQHVDFPTFVGPGRDSVLDLVFSDNPQRVGDVVSLPILGSLTRANVVFGLHLILSLVTTAYFKNVSWTLERLIFKKQAFHPSWSLHCAPHPLQSSWSLQSAPLPLHPSRLP